MGMLLCLGVGVDVQADDGVESAGNVLTAVLPAAATGLTIGLKDGSGALQLAKTTALTLVTTYVLKYAVNEERPNGKDYSFPSAHASISFASAEFMCKRYGWKFGLPAYALASFVAYSRVEANQHYNQDVIAGAIIGIGSSCLFTRPFHGWQIQAETGGQYYGMRLSRAW